MLVWLVWQQVGRDALALAVGWVPTGAALLWPLLLCLSTPSCTPSPGCRRPPSSASATTSSTEDPAELALS